MSLDSKPSSPLPTEALTQEATVEIDKNTEAPTQPTVEIIIDTEPPTQPTATFPSSSQPVHLCHTKLCILLGLIVVAIFVYSFLAFLIYTARHA
ncbi:hypothetical protein M5689_016691 [Euphorbia peplus]|nr:hypothetical protein M5689_016689 [Euphorbia peplus]WCJ35434.1 hypothetical protein M5689_016691 [Euphorbia peplus]